MTKQTEDELKPCPFCGHSDIRLMVGIGGGDRGYSMLCGGCGIRQGSTGRSEAEAVAAWNSRAALSAINPDRDHLSKIEWAEKVERDTARLISESFTNGRNAGLEEVRLNADRIRAEERAKTRNPCDGESK